MKKVVISIAKPEDGEQVADVFYKTWLATYPNEEFGITIDDIEDRFEKRRLERKKGNNDRIKNPPVGEKLLVAKEGEKVVGVCRIRFGEEKNQLTAIYVLPEYQGKGIGKKIWEECKKYFNPQKDIYVELATYNSKALEFYKSLGFVDTGRRIKDEHFKMKSGSIIPEMEMVLKAQR